MKRFLKKLVLILCLYESFQKVNRLVVKLNNFKKGKIKKLIVLLRILPKISIVFLIHKNAFLREAILFKKVCSRAKIKSRSDFFFYNPDFFVLPFVNSNDKLVKIGNLTVNYEKILNCGIYSIQNQIMKKLLQSKCSHQENFLLGLLIICKAIEKYVSRIKRYFLKIRKTELLSLIDKVPLNPASNFREALQSILLINSVLWMNDHQLVGLGRLDQILYKYYLNDKKNGIDDNEIVTMIKEFLKLLHLDYKLKSNVLAGDTGQVIVLSGKDKNGKDSSNELTFLFLKAFKELKLPDPKVVLRVHANTPQELWKESFELLKYGLGYPLFSNDDVIIPALIKFGYKDDDAYNYSVSACWEPLIPGKSLDVNNIYNFNLLKPLEDVLKGKTRELFGAKDVLKIYLEKLKEYVEIIVKDLNRVRFKPSPLLSLLIDDCMEKEKDISEGGARYNNYGILLAGLPNIVESLINLQNLIEKKELDVAQIEDFTKYGFSNNKILYEMTKNPLFKFGEDETLPITITNKIVETIYKVLARFENPFGGKYKIGLSSPSYISAGKSTLSSLDGRDKGEPLGIHISPIKNKISFTSLFNFSSSLDYSKAFNGCVTDIIIDKINLEHYFDKFISLFVTFFQKGGMQLQVNVVNYDVLRDAMTNPSKYPNLVVRVWGFSAYFADLPREYQETFLERCKIFEIR